jgi:hypothetical protein
MGTWTKEEQQRYFLAIQKREREYKRRLLGIAGFLAFIMIALIALWVKLLT